MKELGIPPAALEDPNSVEILRSWVAGGAQWVSINPHLYRNRDFKEEWAWGLFLSDVIKHVANAIIESSEKDKQQVIDDILASFEAEMADPTSEVRGGTLQSDPDDQ